MGIGSPITLPWEQKIRFAIRPHLEIVFTYTGDFPLTIRPHILYFTAAREPKTRGFVIGQGWLTLYVYQIKCLWVTNTQFALDSNFNVFDTVYHDILETV